MNRLQLHNINWQLGHCSRISEKRKELPGVQDPFNSDIDIGAFAEMTGINQGTPLVDAHRMVSVDYVLNDVREIDASLSQPLLHSCASLLLSSGEVSSHSLQLFIACLHTESILARRAE